MSVTVHIEGIDRWMELLDPDRFLSEMDRALDQGAALLRDQTKQLPPVSAKRTGYAALGIPVDTGRMRQSIQKRKLGVLEYEISADTNYSLLVAEGTGKMPARPFFQWMLTDFGGLQNLQAIVDAALQRIISV